jgi:hypothetical protein
VLELVLVGFHAVGLSSLRSDPPSTDNPT